MVDGAEHHMLAIEQPVVGGNVESEQRLDFRLLLLVVVEDGANLVALQIPEHHTLRLHMRTASRTLQEEHLISLLIDFGARQIQIIVLTSHQLETVLRLLVVGQPTLVEVADLEGGED